VSVPNAPAFALILILIGSIRCGSAQIGASPHDLFKAERWSEVVDMLKAAPARSA
jgi:hypothetical protein